jgi:hypothetical protein
MTCPLNPDLPLRPARDQVSARRLTVQSVRVWICGKDDSAVALPVSKWSRRTGGSSNTAWSFGVASFILQCPSYNFPPQQVCGVAGCHPSRRFCGYLFAEDLDQIHAVGEIRLNVLLVIIGSCMQGIFVRMPFLVDDAEELGTKYTCLVANVDYGINLAKTNCR